MNVDYITRLNEFNSRHDFDSSDISVLEKNFNGVTFENIPAAWIVPLDDLLSKLNLIVPKEVIKVYQNYGLLSIEFKSNIINEYINTLINETQEELSEIDKDIWEDYNFNFSSEYVN
jgi:hypothetical protein